MSIYIGTNRLLPFSVFKSCNNLPGGDSWGVS